MSPPNSDLKTYKGNCHCGAFKFTISLPEVTSVNECNCSICFKKGYKWVFPGAGCFSVTKSEGSLKEYEFGPKTMAHKFCPTCGTGVMGKREGAPAGMDIGVNANTLQDLPFDLFDLKVNTFNGKALDPQYVFAKFAGSEPTAEIENAKTYYGGCHCGAVTVAMKTEGPLTDGKQSILDCDCSICTRYGTILTYPPSAAFSVHDPSLSLSTYSFGRNFNEHKFCSICGVSVYVHKKEHVPEEQWKKWTGDASQENWRRTLPANLRCFEAVEWEILREKGLIERNHWAKKEPLYVCPE